MSNNKQQLNNIERIETMEEKLGISIEGLNAEIEDLDGDKTVYIYGEVFSTSGKNIASDIEIVATAFNKEGKVIGIERTYFDSDNFFALQPLEMIFMDIIDKPEKIRIYPKKT